MMVINNKMFMRRIGCILLLLAMVCPAFAKTIFVKQNAAGNGTSWTNAYGELQEALDDASAGDQIWVAAGIYTPTYDYGLGLGIRGNHFQMKNGVEIYGGFAGFESSLSQRDIYNNETILSGDLNADDGSDFTNNIDNTIHVFYNWDLGLNASAVLDGFTITGGNANYAGLPYGGGMVNYRSSPYVANCTFTGNSASNIGGGMYNYAYSDPIVVGCTFNKNYALYSAGGMSNSGGSSPAVINCIFKDNTAEEHHGGGMLNADLSSPTVINCSFSGNMAGAYGGGIFNFNQSNPTISNSIFWGNSAAVSGNEFYNNASVPLVAYSNISGCLNGNSWDISLGTDGGGNMDENPNFDAFLQLQAGSPCIDAADGDVAEPADLLGNLRYDDPDKSNIGVGNPTYVDMGAYEYQGDGVENPTLSSISISGSTQVDESSGSQYTCTAYYSDGSSTNVTSSASWSENSSYASISSSGYLTTSSVSSDQSCTITATYGGRADTHSVTIKNATSTTTYSLYVYSSGAGSVPIASTTGQGGTTAYSKTVNDGTTVSLTAPATWNGMTFTGWTGNVISGNRAISLAMNSTKYVIANYQEGTAPTLSSISISGVTQVDESSGAQYTATATYSDGSTANVTGSASWSENSSYASISSSGYLTTSSVSSDQSCTITAAYDGKSDTHSVTIKNAATIPTTYTLSVKSSGVGGVPISSTTGHGGTTDYTKTVNDGTTVTLTAPAIGGATFTGWTGSVNSSSQTISFPMNAARTVTANYNTGAADKPAAPSNLSASAVSTTQINLNWTDNANNELGFRIECQTPSGRYVEIATVGQNVTAYSDTTVMKNKSYTYRVCAANAEGDSSYSNLASATTPRK